MTAWIWVYEAGSNPYTAELSHRFEVRTVAHAREMAALLFPDAPELAASVVVECEYTTCGRRLMVSEEHAPTVDAAREMAYDPRAFHGGWYRALYRGRQADICQWHYEVDPETNRPQKVGTAAAKRRAAASADQLDLFGGEL